MRASGVLILAAQLATLGTPCLAASVPEAVAVLHVQEPGPGRVPEAAPLRFVLTKQRRVFVGGSDRILTAQLDKQDLQSIEKQIDRVRKLQGVAREVRLGPGDERYELTLFEGDGLQVTAIGDPSFASGALQTLGELLVVLRSFQHQQLRRLAPTEVVLTTRQGSLVGGCREWTLPVGLRESLAGPKTLPAAAVAGWPTGAFPASVCDGKQRYVVALRPLLPGEQP